MDDIEKEIEESPDWESKFQETIEKIKEYKIGNYSGLAEESVHSERVETFPPSTPITLNTEAVNDTVPGGAAASSPSSAVSTPSISNRSNEIINSNGIRLPKLNLPHYNGDVIKFHAFWQCFECAVHKNEHVSKINKLNYLKSLQEGQASRSLEGLDISEQNYQQAIDILKSRFGNKQQIVSAHMQALLKLQNCPNESVEQLRRIYDNINAHVRGLESIGTPMEHYGSLLVPLIMSRMPEEITIQVARKTSETIWNKEEILEIIHKEIQAREMGQKVKLSYSKL